MVRSTSLFAVLAATGLVWGQSSAPPSPYATGGRETTLTVHETGKLGQKCRVLTTWTTADGSKAYLVQAVETGKKLTIVEKGLSQGVTTQNGQKGTQTDIYPWTAEGQPHKNSPPPPNWAPPATTATPKPVSPTPVTTVPKVTPLAPAVEAPKPTLAPVAAYPKPPAPLSPVTAAPLAKTNAPAVVPVSAQAPASTRIMPTAAPVSQPTVTPVAGPVIINGNCDPCAKCPPVQTLVVDKNCKPCVTGPAPVAKPIAPVAAQEMKPVCQPCQTLEPTQVVQCPPPTPAPPPSLLTRLKNFARKEPAAAAVPSPYANVPTGTPPTPLPVTVTQASQAAITTPMVSKSVTEPSQPSDWRQSWGKTAKAPGPVATPTPVEPVVAKKTVLAPAPMPPVMARPPLPVAEKKTYDPLQDPESYLRKPIPDRVTEIKMPEVPVVSAVPGKPPGDGPPRPFDAAPGTASVVAAGSLEYVPVPVGTSPDTSRLPEPPMPAMPKPPMPVRPTRPVAVLPPAPPTYGPTHEVNAFTDPAPPMPPSAISNGFGPVAVALPDAAPPAPKAPPVQPLPPLTNLPPAPAMPTVPVMPMAPLTQVAAQTVVPAPTYTSPVGQTMATLKNSLLPSEREVAAWNLGKYEAKACPDAVEALLTAAAQDPAPAVRTASIRALVKMNACSMAVVQALEAMRSDREPAVQQEVDLAVKTLAAGMKYSSNQGVQQAPTALEEKRDEKPH